MCVSHFVLVEIWVRFSWNINRLLLPMTVNLWLWEFMFFVTVSPKYPFTYPMKLHTPICTSWWYNVYYGILLSCFCIFYTDISNYLEFRYLYFCLFSRFIYCYEVYYVGLCDQEAPQSCPFPHCLFICKVKRLIDYNWSFQLRDLILDFMLSPTWSL